MRPFSTANAHELAKVDPDPRPFCIRDEPFFLDDRSEVPGPFFREASGFSLHCLLGFWVLQHFRSAEEARDSGQNFSILARVEFNVELVEIRKLQGHAEVGLRRRVGLENQADGVLRREDAVRPVLLLRGMPGAVGVHRVFENGNCGHGRGPEVQPGEE